jgi:hypothetical protein
MTPWPEVAVDDGVRPEEILCLPGWLEPLHLSLTSSRWSVRILRSVIEISAGPMFDTGQKRALRNAIAA